MAKNTATVDKEGNIVFYTTDTKATSGIHWTTVGYTIRRNATKGNPLRDTKYATIWLNDAWKSKKDNGDGSYSILFTIPKSVVDKALTDAGVMDEGEEDTIYLNGIFKVVTNGVKSKTTYWTLKDIKKAQHWNNPNDFDDRFDVKLPFVTASYPVYVRYMTSDKTIIEEKMQKNKVKSGKMASTTFSEDIKFAGKTYELYRSYYSYLSQPAKKLEDKKRSSGDSLASIKKRSAKMKSGGIIFTAMMKAKKPENEPEDTEEEMEGSLPDILEGEVILEADEREQQKFSAQEGIPGTESLYINGYCPEYLREFRWKQMFGEKHYEVSVKRTYRMVWTETSTSVNPETGELESSSVEKSTSKTVVQSHQVMRKFSYWTIHMLNVFLPEQLDVTNGALPFKKAVIPAVSPKTPEISYERYGTEDQHIREPSFSKVLTLPEVTIHGGGSCPSIPSEDFMPFAQAHVSQIQARSDKLLWDGKIVMNGSYQEIRGKQPEEIPEAEKEVGEDVFYQKGYVVPALTKNAVYLSKGIFRYRRFLHIGGQTADPTAGLEYPVEEINDVTVHTPVVCYAQLEDKFADCQMLEPDMSRCALVLGLPFRLTFPLTGQHRNITGYGYGDYRKYTKQREVKFPFDVIYQGKLILGGSWIAVEEENQFFLPTHVEEGKYEVKMRAAALNAVEENKAEEDFANLQLAFDTAVVTVPVEVSGRIYGLSVYDISDYPLWQLVFRKKNSLAPSGYQLAVKDFPIRKGSHPLFPNLGFLKAGYTMRMQVITSGNMEGDQDAIAIQPRFFWYDEAYKGRREVDVYYSETIGEKYHTFLKIGSEMDRSHWKFIKCGDPYLSIPTEELERTAKRKNISLKEVKEREHKIYCYDKLYLPSSSQMLLLPNGMQKWYFEYGLPSEIYIVEKGFDLEKALSCGPVSGKEDFFLRNGNLCLNFDIETIENGKRHLSYINSQQENAGYCNMWRKEGFRYGDGWEEGDIALIALGKSAAHDYRTRGTH